MGSLYICVETPARSYVHEGPHWSCMQPWVCRSGFVVLPQGSCYLPHIARAGVSGSSTASATAILSTRLFRLGVRLWAIRRSEQRLLASVSCRGRRRQGTRVQGSWVHRRRFWTVAIALNTRQGSLLLVVLPDLPSTIWLLLAPCAVLLVPDPTYLAATAARPQRHRLFSFRSIDRLKSFVRSSFSPFSSQTPLVWQTWLLKRSPPSQLPDPAVRHSAALQYQQHQYQAPALHNQPTPPRPPVLAHTAAVPSFRRAFSASPRCCDVPHRTS
ncbi:hypothetical protein Q7P35_008843 [Cladosporium inversicolor]